MSRLNASGTMSRDAQLHVHVWCDTQPEFPQALPFNLQVFVDGSPLLRHSSYVPPQLCPDESTQLFPVAVLVQLAPAVQNPPMTPSHPGEVAPVPSHVTHTAINTGSSRGTSNLVTGFS
jgi:hypothetical protein